MKKSSLEFSFNQAFTRMSGSYSLRAKQEGVVLILGLIMVLLMTVVGLAAIRGSGFQENMAANVRDVNVSFQAAESALTVCEAYVDLSKTLTLPNFNNTNGFLKDQNASATPAPVANWVKADWDAKGKLTALDLKPSTVKPSCVVEYLEYPPGAFATGGAQDLGGLYITCDPQLYRITSVGYGFTNDTSTVLQSTFKRPFQ